MFANSLGSVIQRRFRRLIVFAVVGIFITYVLVNSSSPARPYRKKWRPWDILLANPRVDWANRPMKHPIALDSVVHPPQGTPRKLPRIQHDFSQDTKDEIRDQTLADRRESIRDAVKKTWAAYRQHAWGYDELKPLSRSRTDTYGGWGVTIVDSLDTLWITGLKQEFREAVQAVTFIDWNGSTASACSLFETNIRYLGGLLSAYDLSGESVLLSKALELGNMLYAAFDTENHLPAGTLHFRKARAGNLKVDTRASFASVATLSMEFTRLSQLTGDPKFYTVIDNLKQQLNHTQDTTMLPGMWPMFVNLRKDFVVDGSTFTLGGQADSGYEYLPKMYALLGGLDETYATMHKKAMTTAKQHLLFRAMIPGGGTHSIPDVLFSGTAVVTDKEQSNVVDLIPRLQHLACFVGGHFALGGKLTGLEDHVTIGEQLARGCAWAYGAMPSGIMPDVSTLIPCKTTASLTQCGWNEGRWNMESEHKLPRGFRQIRNARYLLRPEAIESLFVVYRITGKSEMQDLAWEMFQAIRTATETESGFASVEDVTVATPVKFDSMEASNLSPV